MKNIITSIITTITVIVIIMVVMSNITPKQPIVTENVNLEQTNAPAENGIVVENQNQNQNNNISTSAVVGIAVEKRYGNKWTQKLGNNWSVGSGFIVDSTGYIVTNYHVIGNTDSEVYITLYGGDTVKGRTVWANSDLDLAIIKIEVAGLPYMKLGDSMNLTIGEEVYAIGNPLGFEFQRTVTSGIVSGTNRSININGSYMEDLIQTDASINSGNSGGPLVNKKGEVIGINTIKVESAEGIGFAIPVNQIKPIIESFKETGEFKEISLGIQVYDREMISSIDSTIRLLTGVYVYKVERGSLADNAGIKENDILLSMENQEIKTVCQLREILYSKKSGETVNIDILRNDIPVSIQINL
ncbi:MAG: trypsin-like serine protease [Clostridiales bacterium]|nr:trypsin-like serine protease [Clostridiales bacterium]